MIRSWHLAVFSWTSNCDEADIMIPIKKRTEPRELAAYRQLEGATYQNMHGAPTERRKKDGSNITVYEVVLHRLMEEQGHLCAYCMRRIPEKRGLPRATARRKNRELMLNPLKPESLTGISYRSDGTIFSLDPKVDEQLNNVLNLNCEQLQMADCRKAALQTLVREIKKRYPTGEIKTYCRKQLELYQEHMQYKTPYVGVLIDWLKKHT